MKCVLGIGVGKFSVSTSSWAVEDGVETSGITRGLTPDGLTENRGTPTHSVGKSCLWKRVERTSDLSWSANVFTRKT